ncbi:nucleoside hydrolase [Virgibacillus sp. NKC19-3]|uniref:nucleoside hydrolase n=1 Tax=Virgibacillus saliphilus TaxID=2831674 RepID=UPI001C9AFF3C|nr:nucleoside hydrolase [Virgibacillus sp. NKC19-3]MBY7144464.1 nucleoside hydrolase [Virgibacillus sp. NKC19-3]
MEENVNVIMDCDPGHDDAIAIILAASKISKLNIEAITTVAGNVEVEKNTLNALKVSDIVGLEEVPIVQGADRPLFKKREIAEEIHGETGLEGPLLPKNPSTKASEGHAVDLIIDKVLKSDKPITLVPTGPLTNIALAMMKEPKIIPKIKEIVLMGGGSFGNWTPAAEFNIYVDAEAAKVVFESDVPITMFGLDVTHQALATEDIIKDLSKIDNTVANFVVELLTFFSKAYKGVFGFEGGPIHDACTVAYLMDPSLFDFNQVHVDIETKGEYTYGMTAIDHLGVTGKAPNVKFAHKLHKDKFWNLLTNALESYSN